MKSETVIKVIKKLIGDVEPAGEYYEDNINYQNLKELEQIMYHFTNKLVLQSYLADSREYSIKRSGEYAKRILVNMKDLIDDALEE